MNISFPLCNIRNLRRAANVLRTVVQNEQLALVMGQDRAAITKRTRTLDGSHFPEAGLPASLYRDALVGTLAAVDRIDGGAELFSRFVYALALSGFGGAVRQPGGQMTVNIPDAIGLIAKEALPWHATYWAHCDQAKGQLAQGDKPVLASLGWALRDLVEAKNGRRGDIDFARVWLTPERAGELLKRDSSVSLMGLRVGEIAFFRHGYIWLGANFARTVSMEYVAQGDSGYRVRNTYGSDEQGITVAYSETLTDKTPDHLLIKEVMLTRALPPVIDPTA